MSTERLTNTNGGKSDERKPDFGEALTKAAQRIYHEAEAWDSINTDIAEGLKSAGKIVEGEYKDALDRAKFGSGAGN